MVAREWGLYSQRLNKKRLLNQCNLPRGIKAATGSGGVRARDLGKTTLTWRGPARQRNAQRGGGVWLSATAWVRLRVRERERKAGWASWASSVAGLESWRLALFFSFVLFFFCFDFQEWF